MPSPNFLASAKGKEISGAGKAKLVEPDEKPGEMDTETTSKKARKSPSKSPASSVRAPTRHPAVSSEEE